MNSANSLYETQDVMLRRWVGCYRRFGKTLQLHVYGSSSPRIAANALNTDVLQ